MHTETKKKSNTQPHISERLPLILSIATAAIIIITAAALVVACVHLYLTGGDEPYTREKAGAYLTALLPFTLTCLLSVVALGTVRIIFPAEKRAISRPTAKGMLAILLTRLGATKLSPDAEEIAKKQRKIRLIWLISSIAVALVLSAAVLVFALSDLNGYTVENCTDKAAYIAVVASVAFLLAGSFLFVASIFTERSYKNEADVIKAEIARAKENGTLLSEDVNSDLDKMSGHYVYILRGAIFIAAVVFIILGISNGSMNDVLGKAVQICTECIGLG